MLESVRKGPYSKQWCNHQLNELISVPDNQDSGTANKRRKRPTRCRQWKETRLGSTTQRPSVRKGPDSKLLYETVRRDRTRPLNTRPSEETGLVTILRDRQKRPDSLLYQETVRRDRTLCYTKRPSEETGLFAILRDRQKRPDSIRSSRTVVVARQPLASRDKKFYSSMFVEQPLYTHWQCPQCNARKGHRPA